MDASQVRFEQQTQAECKKQRDLILQQIEIKMVDNRVSDFIYKGFDGQPKNLAHPSQKNNKVKEEQKDDNNLISKLITQGQSLG